MNALITLLFSLTLLSASLSSIAAEQLFESDIDLQPALAKDGQYEVGVKTITANFVDQLNTVDFISKKDRVLTFEVWYPSTDNESTEKAVYDNETRMGAPFSLQGNAIRDAAIDSKLGKFPLIVLSHGYTGYRSIMFYLGEHLASHGYVVAAIDHTDSRNVDVDFTKNSGSGFPSTLYFRSRDQQFTLDYFKSSEFASISNTDDASVIGYSMGGYGAINTVGACYDFSAKKLQSLGFKTGHEEQISKLLNSCSAGLETADKRWKSMIAMAPWGGLQSIFEPNSLNNVVIPSLFIGGEKDTISGYKGGVKKLYESIGAKDKYLMVYENAEHNIAPHPAPAVALKGVELDSGHYVDPLWNTETINLINEHIVLAFLNCHVKSKQSSCDMLPTQESSMQTKNDDGTLSKAWPGFKDNWGAGVQFKRAK